ncbi:DUF4394 domain-containing protein [Hymenobacter arizonensis]|uniref:DUF4394 domain-containing protein n=1 Tax=Hymenobacter arizonensis TaxID=1227077 RepID=A0A1I5YYH7_HYMAR|nr:DUF4394 domain-containing protein [Hymenobacter arizonensis]SFQ49271.1 protein of unknown function [Hymenobacter arizonensis]
MPATTTPFNKPIRTLTLAALLAGASTLPAAAQTGYALLGGQAFTYRLATFRPTVPGAFSATVTITGLGSGQDLVGLDVRPATGQLYALGYVPSSQQGQLYTLNPATGALTAVGSAQTLALGTSRSLFGFDFNPVADRLRVTAGNGANLRLDPNTGGLAGTDGPLAYASTDANAGRTPRVTASAYTNSYVGNPVTTLYNLDQAANRLVLQNPPNAGTLNTVGTLGVNAGGGAALDIYFNPTTGLNVAYLSISTFSLATFTFASALYTVNLATGATTALGALGNNTAEEVVDIALTTPAPAPVTGQLAYALAGANLIEFDTALPGTIRRAVGITGVDAAQTLAGLDVRPLNNVLYALGYNAAAAAGVANAQVYSLNAVTGVATAAGPAVRLTLGTGSLGMDFNPLTDRIRVVGANRNNYRLDPATGALVATDATTFYASSATPPSVGAIAHSNSFPGSAAGTTLYAYDEARNVLNTQGISFSPLVDGLQTTVGASGLSVNATAPTVDLDIYSTGTGVNLAYLVANTGTSAATALYTVNLGTGAATLVGPIGAGLAARDIALAAATGVVTGTRREQARAGEVGLWPNPFADATQLRFELPRAAQVELLVTDALGRLVALVNPGRLGAGPHTLHWNGAGQRPGLYFFCLRVDGQPAGTRRGLLQ